MQNIYIEEADFPEFKRSLSPAVSEHLYEAFSLLKEQHNWAIKEASVVRKRALGVEVGPSLAMMVFYVSGMEGYRQLDEFFQQLVFTMSLSRTASHMVQTLAMTTAFSRLAGKPEGRLVAGRTLSVAASSPYDLRLFTTLLEDVAKEWREDRQ